MIDVGISSYFCEIKIYVSGATSLLLADSAYKWIGKIQTFPFQRNPHGHFYAVTQVPAMRTGFALGDTSLSDYISSSVSVK